LLLVHLTVMGGMLVGLPYALAAGIAYAWMPARFQQPTVGALTGAASVLVLNVLFALLGVQIELAMSVGLVVLGTIAGFVCALIVRWLRLDWRGMVGIERINNSIDQM